MKCGNIGLEWGEEAWNPWGKLGRSDLTNTNKGNFRFEITLSTEYALERRFVHWDRLLRSCPRVRGAHEFLQKTMGLAIIGYV